MDTSKIFYIFLILVWLGYMAVVIYDKKTGEHKSHQHDHAHEYVDVG